VANNPASELNETRNGRIWPLKKTSSATHISCSLEKGAPHDRKLNSSCDASLGRECSWFLGGSSRLIGRSQSDNASSSSSCSSSSSSLEWFHFAWMMFLAIKEGTGLVRKLLYVGGRWGGMN